MELERSSPDEILARRGGIDLPRVGIRETLMASGLVPSPSVESPITEQIAGVLGAAHLLAGTAIRLTAADLDREETEIRAAAREREKAEAKEAAAMRGLAANDAATALPAVLTAIAEGKHDDDLGELGSGYFARRLALEFGDAVDDDSYRAESLDRMLPVLASAAQRRIDAVRGQARTEAVGAILQGVPGTSDPASLANAVTQIRDVDPSISEDAAAATVGKAALEYAVAAAGVNPGKANEMFDAARSFLGDRLKTEQALAEERLESVLDRFNQDRTREAVDGIYAQLNDAAVPLETVRQSVRDNPLLSEYQRSGFYNTIDARARQRAAEVQLVSTNSLVRDVGLRRWMPDERGTPSPLGTVDWIVRRMDIADPNNPLFIDADRGIALINSVRGAVDFDVRTERIGHAMRDMLAPDGTRRAYIPPATSADDGAIMRAFTDAGIVDTVDQGGGSVVLRGVRDPVRFAFFAKGLNRVPLHVQESIRAGLTGDQQQIAEAAAVYGALYIQAPDLARSIELPPEAALRARFVASRLERGGPAAVADANSIRAAAAQLSSTAVRLDPTIAAYKPEQVLGLAYFKDADAPNARRGTFTSEIRTKAEADIRAGVFDSEAFREAVITPSRFMGIMGNARLDNIPVSVLDSYLSHLSEEFRYAKSLTPSEELAAQGAKAWALDRALTDNPPYAWNGAVYFGRKGDPQLPEDAILDDLATPPNDPRVNLEGFRKMAADRAEDLRNNYIPVWDARQQGYVFRSIADPYELYTQWTSDNVGPLVVNPLDASEGNQAAALTKKIDEVLSKRRERKAADHDAARRAREQMNDFGRRRFGGLE